MKLEYGNAIDLLFGEFPKIKEARDSDLEFWDYECEHKCHMLYSIEFVPYILLLLQKNEERELRRIFNFVERLMSSDDKYLINLAEVSIIEPLYFEDANVNHKAALLKHCGSRTLQSFIECFDDEERAEWDNAKAA